MTEFLSMGGYAGYVWGSYGVFLAMLVVDALTPLLQRRQLFANLRARFRREAARQGGGVP